MATMLRISIQSSLTPRLFLIARKLTQSLPTSSSSLKIVPYSFKITQHQQVHKLHGSGLRSVSSILLEKFDLTLFRQDITKDAKLFSSGIEPGDVNQGEIGNCWFVAALALMATKKGLLTRVVPDWNDVTDPFCNFKFVYSPI